MGEKPLLEPFLVFFCRDFQTGAGYGAGARKLLPTFHLLGTVPEKTGWGGFAHHGALLRVASPGQGRWGGQDAVTRGLPWDGDGG